LRRYLSPEELGKLCQRLRAWRAAVALLPENNPRGEE